MRQDHNTATFLPSLFGMSGVGEYAPKNIAHLSYSAVRQHHVSLPAAFSFRAPSSFGVTTSESSIESNSRTSTNNKEEETSSQKQQPRIAIIGGGIAGVTAANALGKKFATTDDNTVNAKIVVFEGDVPRPVNFGNYEQPTWIAGE